MPRNKGSLIVCATLLASALNGGAGPLSPTGPAGAGTSAGRIVATAGDRSIEAAKSVAEPASGSSAPAQDKTKNATEITAKEANFNSKAHVGVFTGGVVVLSPDFNVKCEKLTAYLRHADAKPAAPIGTADGGAPAGVPAATPTPKPAPAGMSGSSAAGKSGPALAPDQKGSGLEKAIAEGEVVITQDKKNADGTIEHDTGHAERAFYDATSGNVTLTGRPDVQQGGNLCVALSESTIMILNRNGNMRVHGPHKTVLIDNSSPESDPKKSNAH